MLFVCAAWEPRRATFEEIEVSAHTAADLPKDGIGAIVSGAVGGVEGAQLPQDINADARRQRLSETSEAGHRAPNANCFSLEQFGWLLQVRLSGPGE